MPKIQHLSRRGSTFYIRMRIPTDLLPHYKPKTEIIRSLGVTDHKIARQKLAVEKAKIEMEFSNKRGDIGNTTSQQKSIAELSDKELQGLVQEWFSNATKSDLKPRNSKAPQLDYEEVRHELERESCFQNSHSFGKSPQ